MFELKLFKFLTPKMCATKWTKRVLHAYVFHYKTRLIAATVQWLMRSLLFFFAHAVPAPVPDDL